MKQTPGSAGTPGNYSASDYVRASPGFSRLPLYPCGAVSSQACRCVHRPEALVSAAPVQGTLTAWTSHVPTTGLPASRGAEVTAVAGMAVFAGCPPALTCSSRPYLRGGDPGIVVK